MRKAFVKGSELTAKSIGTKAAISLGYQGISENKINFVTVVADSFLIPWVGEFVGNAFFVGAEFNIKDGTFEYQTETIFKKETTAKQYVSYVIRSAIKAVLNQNIQANQIIKNSKGSAGAFGYNVVLHRTVIEIGSVIEDI